MGSTVLAAARTLETERLLLRQFQPDDIDAYAAICGDAEVMRFLGGASSREHAWRHMATMLGHWQLRGYGMWASVEKATGRLLGRIGYNDYEDWPDFEIAWTLGRDAWGKGYASEGARAALAHAFDEMGRRRAISLIHPDNERSIRVAEAIGERFERSIDWKGGEHRIYAAERGAAPSP